MKYTLEPLSENVHKFSIKDKVLPTLQISDIHIDSINCKRDILKSHMDEVVDAGGLIFIYGDIYDVMASYGDKRLEREFVDPQFINPKRSYLDLVVDYAYEFFKPYRENIAFMSPGNHEGTILKYHNTDPLRRLVFTLNQDHKTNIALGAYSGWVFVQLGTGSKKRLSKLHYHHGFGGGAKRSKGILDVQIEVMKYPDADILVRGHTHQKWYDPSTTRVRVTTSGRIYKDKVKYIQSGSYIDGINKGEGGYAVTRNFPPTDIGGWYLDYKLERTTKDYVDSTSVHTTVIETPVHEF